MSGPDDPEFEGLAFKIDCGAGSAPPESIAPEAGPDTPGSAVPPDAVGDWSPPLPALHEAACRRSTWDPFAWVAFDDGQDWALPLGSIALLAADPVLCHTLADVSAGFGLSPVPMPDPPPDFGDPDHPDWEDVRAFMAGFNERQSRFCSLVAALLRANYRLDSDQVDRLIGEHVWSVPEAWVDAIGSCLAGMGPEATALVQSRGVPLSVN